jgi:hypothetical protein
MLAISMASSSLADGIKYTPDASISSNSIKHQTVDVGKGGEIETQFVYLIKGDPSEAILVSSSNCMVNFSAMKLTKKFIAPL